MSLMRTFRFIFQSSLRQKVVHDFKLTRTKVQNVQFINDDVFTARNFSVFSIKLKKLLPHEDRKKDPEYYSDSDSDDEPSKEPKEALKGMKEMKIQTESLRTDALIKNALGISRNKVDLLFYKNFIRINGKKLPKKSYTVSVGDEVDVIHGTNEENRNFLDISRVEILKMTPSNSTNIILKVRKYKKLIIENYSDAPFEESTETSKDTPSKS